MSGDALQLARLLIEAVHATDFEITCADIPGRGNWFDVKDEFLALTAPDAGREDVDVHEIEEAIMFGWRLAGSNVIEKDARQVARAIAAKRPAARPLRDRLLLVAHAIKPIKAFAGMDATIHEAIAALSAPVGRVVPVEALRALIDGGYLADHYTDDSETRSQKIAVRAFAAPSPC